MKNRMKKISALLLAGTMMFSMAACGSDGDSKGGSSDKSSSSEAGSTDEEVTLKITWWGGQARHDYTQKLLDLYTESHPNVKFEAVPAGWDGYFDKLSTQAASGAMPDIVQMDYMYISTYAKNNSIADLQPFIEDGTIDVSGIDEKILNSGKIGDKMAGLVLSSSIVTVGYNPDVLAEVGAEEPTSDWTWSDYIEMNKKVAELKGQPSATVSAGVVNDTTILNYWLRQHGETLFNEDGTGLGYEEDALCADFLQMWKDMVDENIYPDPDEFAQIQTLGLEAGPVVTGEAATVFDWNNYASRVSRANDKIKIATPPLADKSDDMGLWIKPGMFFSVAETSKVKEEAAEFINWFVNSEEANDIISAERGTPVSSKIRDYMVNSGNMSAQQVDMFEYVDKATELSGETPAPEPSGIAEVNEAFSNVGNSVFYGQATAEEAAVTFRTQANEILARNNKK